MKLILFAIALMSLSANAFAKTNIEIKFQIGDGHEQHRPYDYDEENLPQHMSCYQQGMDNLLLNEDGLVLQKFIFASDCQEAQSQQVNGFTCGTDNANGTELINSDSGSIFHFIFGSDCKTSLPEAATGLICATDNASATVLLSSNGRQMQSFIFRSDCEQTRQDMLND